MIEGGSYRDSLFILKGVAGYSQFINFRIFLNFLQFYVFIFQDDLFTIILGIFIKFVGVCLVEEQVYGDVLVCGFVYVGMVGFFVIQRILSEVSI